MSSPSHLLFLLLLKNGIGVGFSVLNLGYISKLYEEKPKLPAMALAGISKELSFLSAKSRVFSTIEYSVLNSLHKIKTGADILSDSLTWFGTGRGLSLHDGENAFTYQSTTDSIVDIFSNPSSTTKVLPNGGVSAITTANDTLLVAFAGDDNDTPIGLGLAKKILLNMLYLRLFFLFIVSFLTVFFVTSIFASSITFPSLDIIFVICILECLCLCPFFFRECFLLLL